MAPQAKLSFQPDPPASFTTEQLACSSATGPFALLPEGGVAVNYILFVEVPRGTRVEIGVEEAGTTVGGQGVRGGSLWWRGKVEGVQGVWTLFLIGATPREVHTIQRVLLFLPPVPTTSTMTALSRTTSPPPIPPSKPRDLPPFRVLGGAPRNPAYRNSLLLLDDETDEILSVVPLAPAQPPPPLPPKPAAYMPETAERGRELAREVDEIIRKINPGENLEMNSPAEEDKVERDGTNQIPISTTATKALFAVSEHQSQPTSIESSKRKEPSAASSHLKKSPSEDQGTDLLDKAMGSLRLLGPVTPIPQPQELPEPRPFSMASISTLATERYETASESGHSPDLSAASGYETSREGTEEEEPKDRREASGGSEWEELGRRFSEIYIDPRDAPVVEEAVHITTGDDEDDSTTPRQSLFRPTHAEERTEDKDQTGDENAVLLRFLGASSTITATRVSREEIKQAGLVPIGEAGAEKGWLGFFGIGSWMKSMGSWLSWSSWSTPTGEPSAPSTANSASTAPEPSDAPTSYPTLSFSMPAFSPFYVFAKSRPLIHRANGEGSSRLSVMFFDEEGYGRRAYIEGAGGGLGYLNHGITGGYERMR